MTDLATSLVIRRALNAPVDRVFKAWTDPKLMQRWFCPGQMTAHVDADPRVGGAYRIEMREASGETHTVAGTYQEIAENARLVFSWRWEGSQMETIVRVDFKASGSNQTDLTIVHSGFDGEDTRDKHNAGWTACLDKLEGAARNQEAAA